MKTKFYALLLLLTLSGGAHAASLSDTAQAAVLSKKIIAAYTAEDYAVAQKLFMEYDQLDAAMPPSLMLVRVRVLYHTEEFVAAYQILGDYLNTAPSDSPDYDTALEMYVALEAKPVVAEATAIANKFTPKCETPTSEGDEACWLKIANHNNCYIVNEYPRWTESVTWSGQCKIGVPEGHGEEVWQWADGGESAYIGAYVNGKRNGQWELRRANGNVHIGPYVDGRQHGRWEGRLANGNKKCWDYSNGLLVGDWLVGDWLVRDC